MELEKLQIDLRPRPNAQALDLGFTALRANAGAVYMAWLMLWLPLICLCGVLAYFFPSYFSFWLLLPWWFKPMLERAPLYILSRQAFGETVTWQDALRAWPKQLGGGWFRLLTWWRPFAAARGLYQPIWQLEGARGTVAAERWKVMGKDNTKRSAFWFGVACAHFELVLQLGLLAFIGFFLSDEHAMNPFAYLFSNTFKIDSVHTISISFACLALSSAIIGPIYTACCFTLYLNRRATLEAWDIEIMLRQIAPPVRRARPNTSVARFWVLFSFMASTMLALAFWHPLPAEASTEPIAKLSLNIDKCAVPDWEKNKLTVRNPDLSIEQAALRKEVAQLYQEDDLRRYLCQQSWTLKKKQPDKPKDLPDVDLHLETLAAIAKLLLIVGTVGAVGWLLYRYRGKFGPFAGSSHFTPATEIGGFDIRPESLPKDVTTAVRQLWADGEHRAALALLYRATLSRLVNEDKLPLTRGATENDCMDIATQALKSHRLNAARLKVVGIATELWLNGAYGNRWPSTDHVIASCNEWQAQFGATANHQAMQS